MRDTSKSRTRLLRSLPGALIAAACLFAGAAQASLVGSTVNVNLSSPTDLVDANTLVHVGAVGTMISSQDSPANADPALVQYYMLTGSNGVFESITFNATSITLRLLSGGSDANGNPTTGWSAGAQYRFTGLDLGSSAIVGFTDTASHIANLATLDGGGWITLASPHEIDLQLADIIFTPAASGTTYADVTINLIGGSSPAVPEPGSLALCGLALAALGVAGRLRKAATR